MVANPIFPRTGLLPFWYSTGRGHAFAGGRCSSPRWRLSILIPNPNALSFCARRLFHRGASLGGIASDPLWAGGGITARGDAVRHPFILFSFSILIPNALPPSFRLGLNLVESRLPFHFVYFFLRSALLPPPPQPSDLSATLPVKIGQSLRRRRRTSTSTSSRYFFFCIFFYVFFYLFSSSTSLSSLLLLLCLLLLLRYLYFFCYSAATTTSNVN